MSRHVCRRRNAVNIAIIAEVGPRASRQENRDVRTWRGENRRGERNEESVYLSNLCCYIRRGI